MASEESKDWGADAGAKGMLLIVLGMILVLIFFNNFFIKGLLILFLFLLLIIVGIANDQGVLNDDRGTN